ncbi:MAG: D-aminoacyl-tRNA deacylase [Rubrivivax sp.]
MIGLLQRVRQARVEVAGEPVGAIGHGLLVFICAEPADGAPEVERFVDKVLKLRVFADEAGRMNRSVVEAGGALLLVSQFTLAADLRGGNRPSFSGAAPPLHGQAIYDAVVALAASRHPVVATGRFGADMQVHLVNDGPVTIPLRIEPAQRA